jgi:hypothetical protein
LKRPLTAVLCLLAARAAFAAQPVIEFYNVNLDHYFITIFPEEATGIDNGTAGPGWHRTARVFGAYGVADAPPEALPVCRFYGNVAQGGPNSHFYTADPAECAQVKLDPGWSYEGIAFYIRLPAAGSCPGGTAPVLRNYNQRFAQHDSNHRYITDTDVYAEMSVIGWAAEGAVFCADASVATPSATGPVVATGATPFVVGCDGVAASGAVYANTEVEPYLSIDPRAPDHFIGVWQQDRWSSGGARGLLTGVSFDGGRSWQRTEATLTRCSGGSAAAGGNYPRGSDPWVTFTPEGRAFQSAISFAGNTLAPGSSGGVLVSRSQDGGVSWEPPVALIADGSQFFDDKDSITADRTDGRYVYAVWDRISAAPDGPSWFARTTNGGDSWEPARIIYDPGVSHQTLNNQIVVLSDGMLLDFFSELTLQNGRTVSALLGLVRSTDKGATWSPRIKIADIASVGTTDPETGTEVRDASGLGHFAADRQGRVFAVWQDSRPTAGARDAIVMSSSTDDGLSWSAPVTVNANTGVQAFIPSVAVALDGTIGVTYYDFRSNTADPTALLTDYWLARSGDGVNWSEVHLDGPFDLATAPNAEGLFLGDYESLQTAGTSFVAFFAHTNSGNIANRTDVVSTVTAAPGPGAKEAGAGYRSKAMTAGPIDAGIASRVSANLIRSMNRRVPNWEWMMLGVPPP